MTYSSIPSHHSMVFDDVRNPLYAAAIQRLVTPDSIVLDLGAGTGILGMLAAAAGARRVYLVEPEPVVQIAREFARANGFDDRVVILENRIEDITLPEPVDLILSVFTGNLLFSEDLLASLYHARNRFLKPGGRLIPDRAELVVQPVSAPDIHGRKIERWSQPNLGLDLSAGRRFAPNEIQWPRRDELRCERLAESEVLTALDLVTASQTHCQGEAICRIRSAGQCHGLLSWIRIRLGDQWLSTGPDSPEVHWSFAFLPLDPPLDVEPGEGLAVGLHRPARGDWTWTVRAAAGSRRHSSFLSRADGPGRLRKLAPAHCPGLDERGLATLEILKQMHAGKCNQEIADSLALTHPRIFPDVEDALQRVQGLALHYGR